jgi:hypothetical protein
VGQAYYLRGRFNRLRIGRDVPRPVRSRGHRHIGHPADRRGPEVVRPDVGHIVAVGVAGYQDKRLHLRHGGRGACSDGARS